jgi:O-antigen/teichoic acid export membrane protein
LEEFDQSSEEGRTDERYRRALLSSLAMFLSRVTSVSAGLFTVYIAAPILGPERIAAWYAIITLTSIIISLDFGIPSAIVNRVVHAKIESEKALLELFAAGLIALCVIGIILSGIAAIAAVILPWSWLLNNSSVELRQETGYLALLVAPTLFLQIVNTGLNNVFLGLQNAFIANLIAMMSGLLSFATIYISVHYMPNAAGMIWAIQGATVFSTLFMLFRLRQTYPLKWYVPLSAFRSEVKAAWSIGKPIFLTSFILIVTQNLDVILASSLLDPQSISELITTQRLFSVFMGAATIITTPLWAAYSDAMIRRDYTFIKLTLYRSIYLNGAMIVIGFMPIILYSTEIFSAWTSGTIIPSKSLVVLSAISAAMGVFYVGFNFYMMGCQIMRPQFFTIMFLFVSNCLLKYLGAIYFHVNGLVIGSLIAFVVTFGVGYGILFRREVFFWAYNSHHKNTLR